MDVNGAKKSCRVCLDWKTTIALQSSRSVCIFHAPAGCLQHICNVLEYSCLFFFSFFFFLEIYKHHTGQQMQIIPEPPWLLGWVTAVLFLLSSCELMEATATPLTTCVLLLWCRHLFYFPTHLFVVSSCVSSLFLAVTQGCRAITGMFLLLQSTFQQRFQVGSNSNNTCRFQSVKSDTVHVYMHVHDQIKLSHAWIFYNAKKSSCSSGAVNCITGV